MYPSRIPSSRVGDQQYYIGIMLEYFVFWMTVKYTFDKNKLSDLNTYW